MIAIIGFADAGYLAFEHIQGRVPPCTILEGCGVVTTSVYSEIFGIPVAVLGAMYYFAIAGLVIAWLDRKQSIILRLVSFASIIGLAASAYFVYLQLFVLKAICIYCMGSAITSTLIFILGMMMLRKKPLIPAPKDVRA